MPSVACIGCEEDCLKLIWCPKCSEKYLDDIKADLPCELCLTTRCMSCLYRGIAPAICFCICKRCGLGKCLIREG